MTVLAVIPARMGSARLPRKNMLEIEPGLTLVQQAIDCATGCGLVDEVIVSTDETRLPVRNAHIRIRPEPLCAPTADIAAAVKDAWDHASARHDFVVTLQPAVLARSPLIVRKMIETATEDDPISLVTMAHSLIWQWKRRRMDPTIADVPWMERGVYPRSQDSPECWAEVNAVTVAPAEAVAAGRRWSLPLFIASIPSWTVALDVDTPSDMATARTMWPWAKRELETWVPRFHPIYEVAGLSGAEV